MHVHTNKTGVFRQASPSQFYQTWQREESQQAQEGKDYGRSGKLKIGDDYYDEVGDARDRDKYYGSLDDRFDQETPESLYRELNQLLSKTHRPLGYSEARRHLYSYVDRRPDGGLYYIYSGEGPKNESEVREPSREDLSNFNCEHVVPQSWFNKKGTPRGDLHHLFTEEVQCNGSRGNYLRLSST